MATMSDMIPQLRNLKEVILPQRISSCDRLLFHYMEEELSNRMPPARIGLEEFREAFKCQILDC